MILSGDITKNNKKRETISNGRCEGHLFIREYGFWGTLLALAPVRTKYAFVKLSQQKYLGEWGGGGGGGGEERGREGEGGGAG